MKKKEYESLKIGDYVSPLFGKNKGKLCLVTYIWDVTDSDGYREILLGANFIDPELSNNKDYVNDLFISYKAFKKEEPPMKKENTEIEEKTKELIKLYPEEVEGGSRWSIWTLALNDGLISSGLYKQAKEYYGELWYYARE
jgi:hypothetical protein